MILLRFQVHSALNVQSEFEKVIILSVNFDNAALVFNFFGKYSNILQSYKKHMDERSVLLLFHLRYL